MRDAGIVVFWSFGDEAEALIERDDVGLRRENGFSKSLSTGFVDGELHYRPPHPTPAVFLQHGHATDLGVPVLLHQTCRPGRAIVHKSENVDGDGVEIVHLYLNRDRLFLYEHLYTYLTTEGKVIGIAGDTDVKRSVHDILRNMTNMRSM
jgi:hypothetical protein